MKGKIWYFGNTTVRSPFRLRDGLIAISNSPLQGNLHGESNERAFRKLLGDKGIVELRDDTTYSVSRKWRSALSQLGFLYPEIPKTSSLIQNDIGIVDAITPNGWRLIKSETVPAIQECFLRSLVAYYIPNLLETRFKIKQFSPLIHLFRIMLRLNDLVGSSNLNFIEMAVIVQLSTSEDDIDNIINKIMNLRKQRENAINKKAFDRNEREKNAKQYSYNENTFIDYADLNFRYIKATGLIQSKGRGIVIIPEKLVFIKALVENIKEPISSFEYIDNICKGAVLPTDDKESAMIVLSDLIDQLKKSDITYDVSDMPKDNPADIQIIRHDIEDLIFKKKEENYAKLQSQQWEEIASYMELISSRSYKKVLGNGEEIILPRSEVPAYFEWVLWRAFLAVNSLKNKPYEARRFQIDQDFLPINTAPGNGPDLIFEFDKYDIVVEVTLTDNSRQEAAEGEPVRRHVAERVLTYGKEQNKKVFGLFIANKIDSNTAETFRIGVWYTKDDEKLILDIIPMTLEKFKEFFVTMFETKKVQINEVKDLLEKCGEKRHLEEAPLWKKNISNIIEKQINNLQAM